MASLRTRLSLYADAVQELEAEVTGLAQAHGENVEKLITDNR